MSKSHTQFSCQECGAIYKNWTGRCTKCGAWSSLIQQFDDTARDEKSAVGRAQASGKTLEYVSINDLEASDDRKRLRTGFKDLDTVLGGGILQGSVSLLAGQPGIGKSTLLMQVCAELAKTHAVLYVSGEESAGQVKLRAIRLGAESPNLKFASSTSANDIAKTIEGGEFDVVIVDSIQTLTLAEIASAPGGISQVTNCGNIIIRAAKLSGTAVVIVGHVTKEGTVAGPKVIEHLVDVVLQFEGDRHYMYRILRSIKNRFGSTSELGIYEMCQRGLREVSNPSEMLLSTGSEELSGVAIGITLEGIRPFLIEAQALVSTAAYGTPQRSVTGFDGRRMNMLLAVLEKRVGFKLAAKDVFLNIAGGLKVNDPALDMAVICAILSSNVDMVIPRTVCMTGEVGLSGEIRPVTRIEQRLLEAEKLGMETILIPRHNLKGIITSSLKIKIIEVSKVEEAFRVLFA